jgi:hypothetical protein
VINAASTVGGTFSPMIRDMGAMMRWFHTGRYVADPARQREVFGEVPTGEEAIANFVRRLGQSSQPVANSMSTAAVAAIVYLRMALSPTCRYRANSDQRRDTTPVA